MGARSSAVFKLLAICHLANDATSYDGKIREMILCGRYVLGRDYTLDYTFESKSRVLIPKDIEKLDVQIFAGIDRWRCKK